MPQILQQDQPDPTVTRGPLTAPVASGAQTGLTVTEAHQIAAANTELATFRSILCPAIKTSSGAAPTTTAPVAAAPSTPATSTSVASLHCNGDDQVLTLQRSLYRTASTGFVKPVKGNTSGNEALLTATLASLRSSEGKVSIVTKGGVNLLGNRARLPITIVNNLTVPVRVELILIPRSLGLSASRPQTVTILAGTKPQLDVTVSTVKAGAGTLLVDAQLRTPQGVPFGAPVTLKVRVSAYGAVVVTITVVVCSLLVLAVIVRLYRRIRNARRGPAEEPAAETTEPEPDPPVEDDAS